MQMREGKIAEAVCRRSVLRQLQTKPQEEENEFTYTANPEMIFSSDAGARGVYRVANHLAAEKAVPIGVLTQLLLPVTTQEEELKAWVRQIDEACKLAHLAVLGGHTQVTRAVSEPLFSFTGIGKKKQKQIPQKNYAGFDVVVTKWVALEGTVLLAEKKQAELQTRYPQAMLDTAKEFAQFLPAWVEAAHAQKSGSCIMQDVSEGGIFGALWELAERAGVGLDIDLKTIPIRQETVEICEFFGLNPYELCGQGSILIFTQDGTALCRTLEKEGISATLIGKTTDKNDRVLWNEDEKRFLEPPKMDEIYKVL
ncbi:MAG: AIR synthase-related protein [Lachnospiraceae bacterium]